MKRFFGVIFGAVFTTASFAKVIEVQAQDDLQEIINKALPGDELHLASGNWSPVVIDKPLILKGKDDFSSVINGNGKKGKVIHVTAEKVTLENLNIKNSGIDLFEMDAGIFLDKKAHQALLKNNNLENNLFGIYIWGAQNVLAENNKIVGRDFKRLNDRGNGINIWNSPETIIRNNYIELGRDGIFVNNSKNNQFLKNRFKNLRFAIHYMYTEYSSVEENFSEEVESAYVIMFSNYIKVLRNSAKNLHEHGLLLNAVGFSQIQNNKIEQANKCSFLYNANQNEFSYNHFADCKIGIHATAGSEDNKIHHNSFINNAQQALYVGTRQQEWSYQQQGNFWSDYQAYDLNGDGIGEQIYKPNKIFAEILVRAPNSRMLVNSPSIQLVNYLQKQFPTLYPGGISDSYPLMSYPKYE